MTPNDPANASLGATDVSPTDVTGGEETIVFDRESLAIVDDGSIAPTELASMVGSVVGQPHNPYLKCIAFLKDEPETDIGWDMTFTDPDRHNRKDKQKLYVENVEGLFAMSKIEPGDYLKSINGRKCGPSLNGERALERMQKCYETEGFLSVATANKETGDDILIEVTIIKPRSNMTYEEMGMVVWFWGHLCIKSIDKKSIFAKTVLKENDQVVAINDVILDKVKPEHYAELVNALTFKITLTVLRRRQRITGKFS
mmetsp:Transcript_1860/g.2696  ORF Transcript_1860/g.2696 Transcript_1860/m.2696 type:complete len:256 (-) Transcript_1860:335-1102(-)